MRFVGVGRVNKLVDDLTCLAPDISLHPLKRDDQTSIYKKWWPGIKSWVSRWTGPHKGSVFWGRTRRIHRTVSYTHWHGRRRKLRSLHLGGKERSCFASLRFADLASRDNAAYALATASGFAFSWSCGCGFIARLPCAAHHRLRGEIVPNFLIFVSLAFFGLNILTTLFLRPSYTTEHQK